MEQAMYINNTGLDLRFIEKWIIEACKSGSIPEELQELFVLTKLPEGSGAIWKLEMKEDD